MKKRILLFLIFISATFLVMAQQKKAKYNFHSVNNLALVNGNSAVSTALQSVNGIQHGPWFAGLGVGIDYYRYRTVPLFADLRYSFGKKKNKFFAYADAGMNFTWVQDHFIDNPTIWNNQTSNRFKNGIYTDIGFGYSAGAKNGNAFVLSLGHSHKSMEETETYQDWRTREWLLKHNSYDFNRIMLKIGWQF